MKIFVTNANLMPTKVNLRGELKSRGKNAEWWLVYFGGVRGDVSSALGQNSSRLSNFDHTHSKMAAANDSKDILCLFDVDGTVTPARLVS